MAECLPCLFNEGYVCALVHEGEESMKTRLRAVLVAVAVAFVFSTWTFAADSGADLYKSKCASCHGAAGKGDTAMGKAIQGEGSGLGRSAEVVRR